MKKVEILTEPYKETDVSRTFFAEIKVSEEAIERSGLTPGEYLEKEMGWTQESGISISEWSMVEDDSDCEWERYIHYLHRWAFDNSAENEGECPLNFNTWKARENQ